VAPIGRVARVAGRAADEVAPRAACAAEDIGADARFRWAFAHDGEA